MGVDGIPEPLTELAQGAAAVFELFSTYVQVGFTPGQALYLVSQMQIASMNQTNIPKEPS